MMQSIHRLIGCSRVLSEDQLFERQQVHELLSHFTSPQKQALAKKLLHSCRGVKKLDVVTSTLKFLNLSDVGLRSDDSKVRLLSEIQGVNDNERQSLVESSLELLHHHSNVCVLDVVGSLKGVPETDRSALLSDIISFLDGRTAIFEVKSLVRKMSQVNSPLRRQTIELMKESFQAVGHDYFSQLGVLDMLASSLNDRREALVEALKQMTDRRYDGMHNILREIKDLPLSRLNLLGQFFQGSLCLEPSTHNFIRYEIVKDLCHKNPQYWHKILEAINLVFPSRPSIENFVRLIHSISSVSSKEVDTVLSMAQDLMMPYMTETFRANVLCSVATVPGHQREEFVRIIRPVVHSLTTSGFELLRLSTMTPQMWEGAAQRLLVRVDRENVMRGARISASLTSFKNLQRKYPVPPAESSNIAMKRWIKDLESKKDESEARRALVTLCRDSHRGDRTSKLLDNPKWQAGGIGLGQLAVFVSELIKVYVDSHSKNPEQDQQNLQASLIHALAECIDGNIRVCDVGISQRLLSVLQGYFPEVQVDHQSLMTADALLSYICTNEHERQLLEQDSGEFYHRAMKLANEYYQEDEERVSSFQKQLDRFFELSGLDIPLG